MVLVVTIAPYSPPAIPRLCSNVLRGVIGRGRYVSTVKFTSAAGVKVKLHSILLK